MQRLGETNTSFLDAINAAIKGDTSRTNRTLDDFKNKHIQFESAGTVGRYSTEFVSRPREDWLASSLNKQMIQPAAVQADMLELAALVHNYNIVVFHKNAVSPITFLNRIPSMPAMPAHLLSKIQFTPAYLLTQIPSIPVCLLDFIQSINIFSSYQETRFLFHSQGHYQAAQLKKQPLHSAIVLSYGRTQSEWYARNVKTAQNEAVAGA
jgi:hypothetical protein